jgi:hypothetical protein
VPADARSRKLAAADLGLAGSAALFVAVAAVDAPGHESLFAYPEQRCDANACAVPPAALDVTTKN